MSSTVQTPWTPDQAIALDTIARTLRYWLEYDIASRASEGLSSDDDTHLIAPPTWPRHGALRKWAEVIEIAALAAQAPKQGGAGLKVCPEEGTSDHLCSFPSCTCAYKRLPCPPPSAQSNKAAVSYEDVVRRIYAALPDLTQDEAQCVAESAFPEFLRDGATITFAASWPTREKIAQALYEHDVSEPRFLWPIQNERLAAKYRSRADAILALCCASLAAPTPQTDDLAGLSAGATPGPWRHIVGDDYYIESDSYPPRATHNPGVIDTGWWLAVGNRPDDYGEANSKFIVAVVNAYRDGRLVPAPAAPQATAEPVAWAYEKWSPFDGDYILLTCPERPNPHERGVRKIRPLYEAAPRAGGETGDGWSTDMEAGKRESEVDLWVSSGAVSRSHRRCKHYWDPQQRDGGAWSECADREIEDPRDRLYVPARWVTHWRKPPAPPAEQDANQGDGMLSAPQSSDSIDGA